jgi:hypothetical protein
VLWLSRPPGPVAFGGLVYAHAFSGRMRHRDVASGTDHHHLVLTRRSIGHGRALAATPTSRASR